MPCQNVQNVQWFNVCEWQLKQILNRATVTTSITVIIAVTASFPLVLMSSIGIAVAIIATLVTLGLAPIAAILVPIPWNPNALLLHRGDASVIAQRGRGCRNASFQRCEIWEKGEFLFPSPRLQNQGHGSDGWIEQSSSWWTTLQKIFNFGTKSHENMKWQHGAGMFQSFRCNFTAPHSPFSLCTADFCRRWRPPMDLYLKILRWNLAMSCEHHIFVKVHPKLNEVKTCSNNLK